MKILITVCVALAFTGFACSLLGLYAITAYCYVLGLLLVLFGLLYMVWTT